jgi:hypothetical protein
VGLAGEVRRASVAKGVPRSSAAGGRLCRGHQPSGGVELLEKVVGCQFDVFVPPLRRAVYAGDQSGAMDSPQVAIDEGVARLRVIGGTYGQTEMP